MAEARSPSVVAIMKERVDKKQDLANHTSGPGPSEAPPPSPKWGLWWESDYDNIGAHRDISRSNHPYSSGCTPSNRLLKLPPNTPKGVS